MLRCFILFLACSLSAQSAQNPKDKYKAVKADKPGQRVAALNALADQGYRLVLPGPVFVMRLEATPPDTYRYLAVDWKGGPVQFVNWLNEQGALGYRWVLGAEMMEKEHHPRNYEYISPGAGAHHFAPAKTDEISSLIDQGYQPVGLAWFALSIGSPWREMFFEREMGVESKSGRAIDGKEVEIADAMRAGNVMKQIDELAKNGYRYLSPTISQKGGGLAVMMQKCGQDCGGSFEYRYFDVHDPGQLDRELTEQGKAGFRVVPQALMMRPHVLEHDVAKAETYAYHALQSKDPMALEQELNGKEQQGYTPIGYVVHTGFWTGERFLLLEKISTVSAPAEGLPPSK